MFWEDINQANERLQGTYVLHGERVLYVDRAEDNGNGPILRCSPIGKTSMESISLADPLWNDFHTLPPMGYMNYIGDGIPRAVHMARRPERSRSHGIRSAAVVVTDLRGTGPVPSSNKDFSIVAIDKGYKYRVSGIFPTVSEILEGLVEESSAAFSPTFAICKDSFGLFRLYRKLALIGLISNKGIRLSPSTICYREEVEETKGFDLLTIEVME